MRERTCLQPVQLGPLHLKHRVYLPAHSYGFPQNPKGADAFVAYVNRRMAAGVPLIIIGEAEVPVPEIQDQGYTQGRLAGLPSAELYVRLHQLMQQYGGHLVEQLYHPGGQVWFEEQRSCFAPSSYPQPRSYSLPLQLDSEALAHIRRAFVSSALVVQQTGLSGVELKADQGKLFHQFLSREYNRRSDQFGGKLKNRLRFLLETLEEIRSGLNSVFAVGVRLSGPVTSPVPVHPSAASTFSDITIEETIEIAQRLEESGFVDYISISGETNSTVWGYRRNHGDENVPLATFKEVTAQLKAKLHIPVLLSGRILDLDLADELLDAGFCDLVGITRAFIADAELLAHELKRNQTGAQDVHRPCINCNLSCVGRTWYGYSISCIYDPLTGRESQFPVIHARTQKRFAVVGGGPAGLEFARSASIYGASVRVFEASEIIGGRLNEWSKLPGRSRVSKAIEFWEQTCEKERNIELIRGCPVHSLEQLEEYDGIVIAKGARHIIPSFIKPPFAGKHMTPSEALQVTMWKGKSIIVVDGDRYSDPLGIASWIGMQGAKVTVVTAFDQVGVGLDPVSRASRLSDLMGLNATFHTWCDIRQTDDGGLALFDHCRNQLHPLSDVDIVVWCINALPDEIRIDCVQRRLYYVGDCKWPRGLDVTTKEAHDLAYRLVQQD